MVYAPVPNPRPCRVVAPWANARANWLSTPNRCAQCDEYQNEDALDNAPSRRRRHSDQVPAWERMIAGPQIRTWRFEKNRFMVGSGRKRGRRTAPLADGLERELQLALVAILSGCAPLVWNEERPGWIVASQRVQDIDPVLPDHILVQP